MEFVIKCPECGGAGGGYYSNDPTDSSTWGCRECNGLGVKERYLTESQLKEIIQLLADEEYTEAREIINL